MLGLTTLVTFLQLWPACPVEGWITSEYGPRRHPISKRVRFHSGIDVANVRGTPIHAPFSGTVTRVSRSRKAGLFIVITSGSFHVVLAHLKRTLVKKGDHVERGALVALMGQSGRATGPHVHMALRHGRGHLNPAMLLSSCPETF